ncbi:MAG: polyphosphate--glucose phosphotransferase [Ilumatobacteraceae bacterium]
MTTATAARTGFGIDIGGTGMKAAPVDLDTGELLDKRYRIDTPQPATPEAMVPVVKELVSHFSWSGPVGAAMPAIVRHGVVWSAANIDESWIGTDADALFTEATGCEVGMMNDADAAGVAEMTFGAGRGRAGVVIVLTFGTGIGSGLFVDGRLVPNTELGHIQIDGLDAEERAAASARKRDDLTWAQWASRANRYLFEIVKLFSPELIIIGGGASKRADDWVPLLNLDTEVAVASMANNAGIVGAALMASG